MESEFQPIEKPRRVVDPQAIKRAKRPYCVACGEWGPTIVHHFQHTRGARGPDEDWNLIALCPSCERKAHNAEISKEELKRFKEIDDRMHEFFKEW